MSLVPILNGEAGSSVRAKINTAFAATDTNTTDIAANTADIATNTSDIATNTADIATLTTAVGNKQPLDSDLTAIAGLTPSNDDIIQRKAGAWTNRSVAQYKTDLALTKSDVGLGNVDNVSDANKPVSTAQAAAIALKQDANAVSTVSDNVRNEAADFTLGNSNGSSFYRVINSGASLGNIPADGTIPQFLVGQSFKVLNDPTSAASVTLTPAGGVTLIFAGILTNTLNPGAYAEVKHIGLNTWCRII